MMSSAGSPRWDWMSVVAAILLAGYLLVALHALSSPSSDPQRGMAIGFIVPVTLILIVLGGLLWLGVARGRRWLVRVIFVIAVLPALLQTAQMIYVHFLRASG